MDIDRIMEKLEWIESMLHQRFLPEPGEINPPKGIKPGKDFVVSIYNLETKGGVIRKGDVFQVIEEFMLPITNKHGVIIEYTPALIGLRLRDKKKFLLYREAVESLQ